MDVCVLQALTHKSSRDRLAADVPDHADALASIKKKVSEENYKILKEIILKEVGISRRRDMKIILLISP